MQAIQALILSEVGRDAEAKRLIADLLAAPQSTNAYVFIWAAASHARDAVMMVRAIEGMAASLGSADAGQVLDALPPEMMFPLAQGLKEQNLMAYRVRLAEALLKMGWQRADPSSADWFRSLLVDHYQAQGRREEAARLAREISSPASIINMRLATRYDSLVPTGDETLRRALEEEDRGTASLLAAAPGDVKRILERMSYLRSVGRNEEAVALARPYLADVQGTVEGHELGVWIVNDAAFALIALGRGSEALEAMRTVAAMDMSQHPQIDLISASINYSGMLWQAGKAEESLAHVARLRPLAETHASEYGRMWIRAHGACANAALGKPGDAAADIRQLREKSSINAAAHNMALLCTGDLTGSEKLLIDRLESEDPSEALLALQDFELETRVGPGLETARRRLREVRDRPAVRAVVQRVGRIISLPVDRAYYGTF